MKNLLLLIPIVALLLLPMGCADVEEGIINRMVNDMMEKVTGNFTIKVGGTDGLDFTGEYEVWYLHYDPESQSVRYTKDSYTVEGQVPEEYTFEGNAAAAFFQSRTDDWSRLSVEIWRDEALAGWSETTDAWGVVWVPGAMIYE